MLAIQTTTTRPIPTQRIDKEPLQWKQQSQHLILTMNFYRYFNWLANFSVCARNLGLITAIRIFLVNRLNAKPFVCNLKKFGVNWWMRGEKDFRVMHQFWYRNYRICEMPDKPVKWIIDAGANIGDSALRFLAFHPTATVIALEPEPENAALLQRNVGWCNRTIIERKGLWHTPGQVFLSGNNAAMDFQLSESPSAQAVTVTSIDQLCEDHKIGRIGILKLDIEGAEKEIFAASNNWIGRCDCIVWELNDHQCSGATQTLMKQLADQEFDFSIIDEYFIGIRSGSGLSAKAYRYLDGNYRLQ